MSRLPLCSLCFLLFLAATAAQALATDEAARAIVEKAIDAQGGEEQVAKLTRAWHAKIKGTKDQLVITGRGSYESPGRGTIETTLELNGQKTRVVAVCDVDKAWVSINGQTREVTGDELKEVLDGGYRSRRVRFLLPLVKDPEFRLSLLGDKEVAGRPATAIRVQSQGHRDIDLYFDKENGLLVKTESRVVNKTQQEMVLEQVISEYKDFGGVNVATKFTKYENGKLLSVEEITEMTFVDKLDPREYSKP